MNFLEHGTKKVKNKNPPPYYIIYSNFYESIMLSLLPPL